jgi:ATP-dependent DNA helicase RecQ
VAKSSETRLTVAVDRLRRAGALTLTGNGDVGWTGRERAVDDYVATALAEHERYRVTDRTRTEMLERYLETDGCRWRVILGYFGQPSEEDCGHCDNCRTGASVPPDGDAEFRLGRRVRHATFGAGEVIAVEGDTITVLFSDAGYRTLSLELVRSGGLLTGV